MVYTQNRDPDSIRQTTQVVVIAGGKAKRLGINNIPKCMLDISGAKKLIDLCIESVVKEGFRNFVFLLGHKSEMVMRHIGDGQTYGINATYSIDPPSESGWGKGKAFKHALLNGKINAQKRSIVVFPDDIVLQDELYSKLLKTHIQNVERHAVSSSIVLVPGTQYPYGAADLDHRGIIRGFVEKPFVNKPTSVGIYVFEPEVYGIVQDKISLDDPAPVDLESTIMPELVSRSKLSSFMVPGNSWLPINTLKEYEQATRVLQARISHAS
jgi:NDP-sugar pyrophosphorylase family protein